jgi:hypothetical protein
MINSAHEAMVVVNDQTITFTNNIADKVFKDLENLKKVDEDIGKLST